MNEPRLIDELDTLIGALLDRTITPSQMAALAERIRADEPAADRVAELMLVASDTVELLNAELPARNAKRAEPVRPSVPRSAFRVRGFAYALAAAVLLAAAGVAVWLGLFDRRSTVDHRQTESPIAMVTDTAGGGTLIVNDRIVAAGSEVRTGEYTLDRGTADFWLSNGVNLKLRGDSRLVVADALHATLTRGDAAFYCPHDAEGFAVDLPGRTRVTDLGTAFRIVVGEGDAVRVDVTEGKVRVSRDGAELVTLAAGQSVRWIAAGPLETSRASDSVAGVGIAATTGSVQFLHVPPASVGDGELEHDTAVRVFIERSGVRVPPGLVAFAVGDGAAAFTPDDKPTALPADARVDCYLLHYDPVGERFRGQHADASITFDRSIVAVIYGQPMLASDPVFANPLVDYSFTKGAAVGPVVVRSIEGGDNYSISADRRTLTVHFSAIKPDQIRVLVAAADDTAPSKPQPTPNPRPVP